MRRWPTSRESDQMRRVAFGLDLNHHRLLREQRQLDSVSVEQESR